MTTSTSKSSVLDPYPVLLNGLVVITVGLLLMVSPIGFRYTWAQDNDDSNLSFQTFTQDLKSSPVQLNEVTLGDSFKWTLQAIVAPEHLYDNLPMYGYKLKVGQVTSIENAYGQIVERYGQQKVADEITNNNTPSPTLVAPVIWYVGIADKECGTSGSLVSVKPMLYSDLQKLNTLQVESNEELGRCFMSSKPIQRVIDEGKLEPIKLWVSRKNWADSYNQRINDLLEDSNEAGSFITP